MIQALKGRHELRHRSSSLNRVPGCVLGPSSIPGPSSGPRPSLDAGAQEPVAEDVTAGLALTGYFLLDRVLEPHGKELPPARLKLDEIAERLTESE